MMQANTYQRVHVPNGQSLSGFDNGNGKHTG